MACYREAFVQASNLAFLWIFTDLWKVVWKTLSRFILLQKGTDFLGSEGICTWRYSSQQRVMLSILQTELFQICSCLGNLHPIEPSLQPELLNHFFHSCNAGWTRNGALERMADLWAVGRSVVGLWASRRGWAPTLPLKCTGPLSMRKRGLWNEKVITG